MRVTRALASALVAAACGGAPDVARAPYPQRDEPAEPAPWEGRYALTADRGHALPTALPPEDGCSIELLAGTLALSGGRFLLVTTNRERCPDGSTRQESTVSEGAARVEGDTLRLEADRGSAFDAATGAIAGAEILLVALESRAGPAPIDWRFTPPR